jgi:hypothetical protein
LGHNIFHFSSSPSSSSSSSSSSFSFFLVFIIFGFASGLLLYLSSPSRYFDATVKDTVEERKVTAMSFLFDRSSPGGHNHPSKAPGFGMAPDPFTAISRNQNEQEDDADR